jgi:hypothetical protein
MMILKNAGCVCAKINHSAKFYCLPGHQLPYIVCQMSNSFDTNFDPPYAHFVNICFLSNAQSEKLGNPNEVTVNTRPPPPPLPKNAVKWSQICRRIELRMREIV